MDSVRVMLMYGRGRGVDTTIPELPYLATSVGGSTLAELTLQNWMTAVLFPLLSIED